MMGRERDASKRLPSIAAIPQAEFLLPQLASSKTDSARGRLVGLGDVISTHPLHHIIPSEIPLRPARDPH